MSQTSIKDYSLPFSNTDLSNKPEKTLTFDLHPLYASILRDGIVVRKGEVLGLDVDLQRVFIAPFTGTVRLLTTGNGAARRVKVFLTDANAPASNTRNRRDVRD